jgi:hypothetical protein
VCAWAGRSWAAGEVRVVLAVAWSPRAVSEVVVGLWNVLGKLQDRLQLSCSCFWLGFLVGSMGGSRAAVVGGRECAIVDAGVCGDLLGVVWEWWDMLGKLCRNCRQTCKVECGWCRRSQERAIGSTQCAWRVWIACAKRGTRGATRWRAAAQPAHACAPRTSIASVHSAFFFSLV